MAGLSLISVMVYPFRLFWKYGGLASVCVYSGCASSVYLCLELLIIKQFTFENGLLIG